MLRKLVSFSQSSTFGVQTVVRRTKANQWGSYGYSNFGHDQPDHFPLITKCFHLMVGCGLILPMLNWEVYWPIITKKYYSVVKKIGFQVSEEAENPPEKKLKFVEYKRRHRDRTMPVSDPKES